MNRHAHDIDALTEALLAERDDEVRSTFAAEDRQAPLLVRSPDPALVADGPLGPIYEHWLRLCMFGSFHLPRLRTLDMRDLQRSLDRILIVDVLEGGEEFHVRLCGDLVSAGLGRNITGATLGDVYASSGAAGQALRIATYRAIVRRPEPVYTAFDTAEWVPMHRWEELAVPFVDDDGQVVRLVIGNNPTAPRALTRGARALCQMMMAGLGTDGAAPSPQRSTRPIGRTPCRLADA